MATYHVTGPDGHVYEVTGPDGATDEQVLAQVQAHAAAPQAPAPQPITPTAASPEDLARQAYDDSGWAQRPLIAAGAEFQNLGRGIGQLLTPNDSDVHRSLVAASDAAAPFQDAPHGVSNVVGRALPYLATLPVGGPEAAVLERLPQAGRLAQVAIKAGTAAAEGGAYGGLQETRTGQSRAQNVEMGAGLGVAGRAFAGALRTQGARAASAISDEARQVWQKAQALGIDLTPAQLSDSRIVKYMAHQFGMLPLSGGAAAHEAQSGQFNRQIAKAIGVDAPRVTPEVYAAKKAADSAAFNDLTARNNLTVTPDLATRLHAIEQDAKIAGGDAHTAVRAALDRFYSQMSPDGIVPGRAYQALDSALGRATKGGTPVSHYIGQVKGAIRDAMDASISPEDAAAWRQLRTEYGNRKTIRDMVAEADGGDLPPAQLKGRVIATNYGKEAMASGTRGVMGDLATIGSRMKPPPTSGTGERNLVNDMVNPFKWPGLLAGATAGRIVNSNRLARVLVRQGRGKTAQRLAVMARGAPLLMPQQQGPDDAGDGP